MPSGTGGIGAVVCGDSDRDSLDELTFYNGVQGQRVWFWQLWENRPTNRYDLVKAETCVGNPYPPPGIHKGLFHPWDIGDIDDDGLMEFVGGNEEWFGDPVDSIQVLLCLYESPTDTSYPDSLVWTYCFGSDAGVPKAWLPGDLDRDGRKEIVAYAGTGVTYVFENRGNNRNDLVYTTPSQHYGCDYAFGDFDLDGATEFAFAPVWSDYLYVYECDGDDHYSLTDSVFHHFPNGADVFSGNDLDQDGKPEFYVVYMRISGGCTFYVVMYEAVGDNAYEGVLIDSLYGASYSQARHSVCSDIDSDGREELLVSYNSGINVYVATGNNTLERVYNWRNPMPSGESHIQCHDMNRNGYQDIVISGNARTWFLEMEAIRVLVPNGGQSLVPGETCDIRWRVYTPPRCDSVSLFLRRDTLWPWVLDTIATGLAPMDSVYSWRVPPGSADSCRIVAIAYGPGRQFDESDTAFRILPGGVAEAATGAPPRAVLLPPAPNPFSRAVQLGFLLNRPGSVTLGVYDASGRRARLLFSGECAAGAGSVRWDGRDDNGHALPTGVYVARLAVGAEVRARRLVLVR